MHKSPLIVEENHSETVMKQRLNSMKMFLVVVLFFTLDSKNLIKSCLFFNFFFDAYITEIIFPVPEIFSNNILNVTTTK